MKQARTFSKHIDRLRDQGIRPTRQRLQLARLLFGDVDRHVCAEQLHREAIQAGVNVSLATVYNTLHQFTSAGMLREISIEPGRVIFDTKIEDHHHFYYQDSRDLVDIPPSALRLADVPEPPDGTEITGIDVVIRVRDRAPR